VAEKTGLLVALEGTCERKWGVNLGGPAVLMNCVTPADGGAPVIFVALADGAVLLYDGAGALQRKGKIEGKPVCMEKLEGRMIAVGLGSGGVVMFPLESG